MNSCTAHVLGDQFRSAANRFPADWESFRNATILLTGGTGFFGKWLLGVLLAGNDVYGCGMRIFITSRDPEKFRAEVPSLARHAAVCVVQVDLSRDSLPNIHFSHIIHAAANADAQLNERDPLAMIDTIVLGTRRILDHAVHFPPQRMLFVSSGAVYGPQPVGLAGIPEDYMGGPDPLGHGNAYHESKRMGEQLCAAAARSRGIPHLAIARCFAFVGPWLPLHAHFAIGNFVDDVLAGRSITIKGDGTAIRSYLYAADLATWLLAILVRGTSLRAYNVGSERALALSELAQLVALAVPQPPEIRILGSRSSAHLLNRYVPEVRRVKDELGVSEWTSLEGAIERMILWHGGDVRLRSA